MSSTRPLVNQRKAPVSGLSGRVLQFVGALRAEALKGKRSLAFWLTIGCSLFIPFIWLLALIFKSETLLPQVSPAPWDYLFMKAYQNSVLLLPFYIVLIVNLIVHIEHRANAWKQLYVQPIPGGYIYCSKLIFILFFAAAAHLLFIAGIFIAGVISDLFVPRYQFLSARPGFSDYFQLLFRSYVSVMGIAGLQYALSYRIKNFSIPFGLGVAGVILAIMAGRAEEIVYLPYAYPMLSLFRYEQAVTLLTEIHFYSLLYFVLFAAGGFLIMKRGSYA